MKFDLTSVGTILAIAVAAPSVAGGLYYAADDYMMTREIAYSNRRARQVDRFIFLAKKRGRDPRSLSKAEWIEWCELGLRYRFHSNCGTPPFQMPPHQPRGR